MKNPYDELLFHMTNVFLVLVLIYSQFIPAMIKTAFEPLDMRNVTGTLFLFVIIAVSFGLSAYRFFSSNEKTNYEKVFMIFITFAVNFIIGFFVAFISLDGKGMDGFQPSHLFPIFQFLTILYSFLLILLKQVKLSEFGLEKPGKMKIIVALLCTVFIFYLCQFFFKSWMTYSAAIVGTWILAGILKQMKFKKDRNVSINT